MKSSDDGDGLPGLKLPLALERVLAFKETRAKQVGVIVDELDAIETGDTSRNVANGAQPCRLEPRETEAQSRVV